MKRKKKSVRKMKMKCEYCREKIKKNETYEVRYSWIPGGYDMGSYYYATVYFHPWCLKIRGEDSLYLENPDIIKLKKIKKTKEEYYQNNAYGN